MRNIFVLALTVVAGLVLASCGGNETVDLTGNAATLGQSSDEPAWSIPAGDPLQFALPNDPDDPSRQASRTYSRLFADTVNEASPGRWDIEDRGGHAPWTLSNTCHSSPKAWLLGGNYWNDEDDWLISKSFTVPAGTRDIKLCFYSRWSILAGDYGRIGYSRDGGHSWTQVGALYDGSNGSYPGWDKYTFRLPNNTSGVDQSWKIAFRFTSDSAGTSFGLGVDDVAVYTTELFAEDFASLDAWTVYAPGGNNPPGQSWTVLTSADSPVGKISGYGGAGDFACPTDNAAYGLYYNNAMELANAVDIPAGKPFTISAYTAGIAEQAWDGLMIQYSLDGGATWSVGTSSGPENFTNTFSYSMCWMAGYINNDYTGMTTYNICTGFNVPAYGSGVEWVEHAATIPAQAGASQLKLRFWFGSDPSQLYQPGICVDHVRVTMY